MIINASLPGSGGVKLACGSYVGTGTYGADNPTSVDVGFEPKAFFVCVNTDNTASADGADAFAFWYENLTGLKSVKSSSIFSRPVTVSGSKISWNVTFGASPTARNQLNTSGTTYTWIALG